MTHGLISAAAEAAAGFARNGGVRQDALAGLERTGLPGARDEDWRFTPIGSLDTDWIPAPRPAPVTQSFSIDGLDAIRIVIVDGWIDEAASDLTKLPDGLSLTRGSAESAHSEADRSRAFEALNLAAAPEPFVLRADGVVEKPVHLVHYSTRSDEPKVSSPRIRVELARSAELKIVEDHLAANGSRDLVNLRVELIAGENATVSWMRLMRSSSDLRHIASMTIAQERDSVVRVQAMTLGGALVRHNIDVHLNGENSECALHGLVVGEDDRIADNHSLIRHRASHARSTEHFRNVLDGRSRAVFAGRVVVEEGVVGTDTRQANANLLLSSDARVDALPQLEIYNDDVKASHGSTLGQLDADSMFYLRSRGIDEHAARAILTWAFANVVVEEIELESVRNLVRRSVFERLPGAGLDESVLGGLA